MTCADKIAEAKGLMPDRIWLLPCAGDEGETLWCEDPAPGAGMREEDAVAYVRADLADAQAQQVTEWREEYRAVQGMNDLLRDANAKMIAERDAQAQEIARLRWVLGGVRRAIDTGRNEPLMIWRDQINIALGDAT